MKRNDYMAKYKSWHDNYEIVSELGEGGNAKVYHVKCKKNSQDFALKDLTAGGAEKRGRFVDEISIIRDNCKVIEGIIPILDSSVEEYWYTMPIAIPIMDHIIKENFKLEKIVQGTIRLCYTLAMLHEKGISHRDIKPSNIYYYQDEFCFGDFGLVEFPDNANDFTRSDKGLGAIFTIAPEMKRNPRDADGKKADVFSLAKTMWMFLTKDEKGFDGVYNYLDSNHSLRYIDKYTNEHIAEIDELLKDATDNDPNMRPTIKEFKERLNNWADIYADLDKSQASDWNFLNKQLFGSSAPDSSSWRNIHKIVETLNIVGKTPAYNHMLFHDMGGLDFSYAEVAAEEDCIKLYDTIGYCHIVKPKILYFEGFDENFRWNYLLLELDQLNPVFDNYSCIDNEYLVEDYSAHYVSAENAQYGVYDYETGTPLPVGFQTVYRYTKGKFLIVMKHGPYNGMTGTYDGRHGDCSATAFREYIDSLIKLYSKLYYYVKQDDELKKLTHEDIEDRILNLQEFNRNPFKCSISKDDNTTEIKNKFVDQQKSKDYIKQSFMNWDFSDMFQSYYSTDSKTIKFTFEFTMASKTGFSLEKLYKGVNDHLCVSGYIMEISSLSDENCYYIYDRKAAIDFKEDLEKRVAEILKENDLVELEKYESCFSIKAIRCGKPMHLFTKQEIEIAMRNADDRFSNQLVIDENGYAKVISNNRHGYLFPVKHESWNAGNVYVGKYSKLSTLEEDYISSLQGWLLYLQTGRNQYMDYIHKNTNVEELIAEINKYYL